MSVCLHSRRWRPQELTSSRRRLPAVNCPLDPSEIGWPLASTGTLLGSELPRSLSCSCWAACCAASASTWVLTVVLLLGVVRLIDTSTLLEVLQKGLQNEAKRAIKACWC